MTQKPNFWLACNGLSMVSRLANNKPIKATEPHVDLLTAARELLNSSRYKVELRYVQGHQDNSHLTVLSRDAWLNIEVDLIAKQKASTPHMGPIHYKLPGNPWGCYADSHQMLDTALWMAINGWETQAYWTQQKNPSLNQLKQVNWLSLKQAMKAIPLGKWEWASKQMSAHFAHG